MCPSGVLSAGAQSGKWRTQCLASAITGTEPEPSWPGPRPPKTRLPRRTCGLRAANELEQAEQARGAAADLNPVPGEFTARQMEKED